MLLKYTLKNIFAKPGRLIIILICMTAACFSGFLAVDCSGSLKGMVYSMLGGMFGKTDYIASYNGTGGITEETFSGVPGCEYVSIKMLGKYERRRDEQQYSYVITDNVIVYAFSSLEAAHSMELIPEDAYPADGEISIGKKYSEKYGYKVGDIITLNDKEYNEHPFTVSSIFTDNDVFSSRYSAVISNASFEELRGAAPYYDAYVNVFSDDEREEFKELMDEKHPNVTLEQFYLSEEMIGEFDRLTAILYLVFVLVFVLVIFVTVSFTEKIITERMSVIGTLRSIGMSMRKTTAILLFENVLYGLAGGLNGLVLYLLVRKLFFDLFSEGFDLSVSDVKLNYGLLFLVILGAVLIQVLVPLKEVLKAVKTSIRDIIFETRDSEYKLSYKKTCIGAVCVVLGLITGFCFDSLYLSSTGILLIIVGSALMIQFIVRKLTLPLAKLFGKRNMPVAELAAVETGSKKPNSGNAVLTVASVAAAAAIFVILNSILTAFDQPDYNTDLIVSETSLKTAKYEYVGEAEGITEVEYIYSRSDQVRFGNEEKSYFMNVISLPSSGQYNALGDIPSELDKYEILIDTPAAGKLKAGEGDNIDITFHSEGVFPVKETLTVKKITSDTVFPSTGTIVLSNELYRKLFPDNVSMILIKTPDPDAVKAALEPTFTSGEDIRTMAEFIEDSKEDSGKFTAVMVIIMAASVVLTLIGISGNQLIGFTARKKEYAMLHSCACSRSKIIRLILTENALIFGISCIAAGLVCIPVSMLISKIMVQADMGIYVTVRYNALFGCIFILWLITMLTSLSPIKSLKKMNTAMELKYE